MNNDTDQRTAGDVLNHIGSMLADLTDELDAMLHMDPNQAATVSGNGSAAWLGSICNMASNSSGRSASMLPISLRTSPASTIVIRQAEKVDKILC